jgi:hypothetical protein
MHNRPQAGELLEAVRDFLEQKALPELRGRNAFHARVAVNALDILRRELDLGAAAADAERQRLQDLLAGPEGTVEELDRELCRRIRAGEITLATPGLAEHLWQTTLDRLAIDQPRYATYRKHSEETGAE